MTAVLCLGVSTQRRGIDALLPDPVIPPVYLVISSPLLSDLGLGTPLLTPAHPMINVGTCFGKIKVLPPGTHNMT